MSLDTYRAIAQEVGRSLSDSEFRVLLSLVSHANAEGKAWPSVGRLVSETGRCDRAVRKALAGLRQRGLIEPAGYASRRGVVRYRLFKVRPVTPRVADDDCPF